MVVTRGTLLLLGVAGLLSLLRPAAAQFNIGGNLASAACDFASFQHRSSEVDLACCQGKGTEVCSGGTPTQCDLECALVYLSFFDDCQNLIMALGSNPTPTVIHVGSSGTNAIEVPVAGLTECDQNPAVPANTQNAGWADTFSVRLNHKSRGDSLIVTRIDSAGGWGQDLEITCTGAGAMAGLVQLVDQCEAIPVRESLDMIDDLLGHCDTVALDCTADGCRGGPPLQCAAAADVSAAEGVTTLAEVITIGEEISYDGLCLGAVGGGWTYVTEDGRSATDMSDVFAEEGGGYHSYVYDLKGMRVNQVLVRRTTPTWCDSWGHTGSYWGVTELNTVSMGIALGTEEFCYNNGERQYKFLSAPFCSRHTGGAAPDGATCPGPQGIPYAGQIWAAADPNSAGDGDLCTGLTVENICADATSTCSTAGECRSCNADGSAVLFTASDPDASYDYLEIENFDAWLQDAGGCDGVPAGGAYFLTTCQTWADARAECQASGGDLVVVPDAAKNVEVTAFMQTSSDYGSCDGPYPWLGATGCTGSTCNWVDGTPWSYTGPGFAVDDPNLHIYANGGNWGTWGSGPTAMGICERPAGVQYEVYIRDSHLVAAAGAGGGGH